MSMPRSRSRHALGILAATVAVLGVAAAPASAFEIINSSANPGGPAVKINLGGEGTLPILPIVVGAHVNLFPNSADVLGAGPTTGPLVDGDAMVGYRFDLPNPFSGIGLRPALLPYVGVRYLGLPQVNFGGANAGYNQAAGAQYGLRAIVGLPLDFTATAYAGASTLTWGQWNSVALSGSNSSGSIDTKGATLPVFGATLAWSPLNLFTAYAGVESSQLPLDLRGTPTEFGPGRAQMTSLKVGLSFLFFSI